MIFQLRGAYHSQMQWRPSFHKLDLYQGLMGIWLTKYRDRVSQLLENVC